LIEPWPAKRVGPLRFGGGDVPQRVRRAGRLRSPSRRSARINGDHTTALSLWFPANNLSTVAAFRTASLARARS
jgi:hypothetical protein